MKLIIKKAIKEIPYPAETIEDKPAENRLNQCRIIQAMKGNSIETPRLSPIPVVLSWPEILYSYLLVATFWLLSGFSGSGCWDDGDVVMKERQPALHCFYTYLLNCTKQD